jgi:hypothetical protein
MKLSEFFPRLRDLGEVRVIANNGTAVLEFNSTLDNVSLGARSWNFAQGGVEFHLYKDKVKAAKLFYGDHPRFNRVGLIEMLDENAETKMMIFLYGDAAKEGTERAAAMQALIADFGENPTIEEETAEAAAPAH